LDIIKQAIVVVFDLAQPAFFEQDGEIGILVLV
jgi:hypothetical protein